MNKFGNQKNYDFLETIKSPKVIVEALKLYGTREIVGKQHSKEILSWAKELGIGKTFTNDEIPWCGLFVAIVVKRAGFEVVKNPLWAKSWNDFGIKQTQAMFGDVLVFTRPGGGGHVGIYVGEDETCYHLIGGNQSNTVNITRILKSRCIGIRRCPWKISQPPEVKKIKLQANGAISKNEE